MTKQEFIDWVDFVKSRRDISEEPIPFNNEMLDLFTKDDLKDYYSKIKHLDGIELCDTEHFHLGIYSWTQIIWLVKERIKNDLV
jgi:hypothetical protein